MPHCDTCKRNAPTIHRTNYQCIEFLSGVIDKYIFRIAETEKKLVEATKRNAEMQERRLASLQKKPIALTTKEHEVLHLIATGLTREAIAAKLDMEIKTVDAHIFNIKGKLQGVNLTIQQYAKAIHQKEFVELFEAVLSKLH